MNQPALQPDLVPRLPFWRQLHIRAALIALPLLGALGFAFYCMLEYYSAQAAQEAGQRMNLGLARYVVEHQEPGLIDAQGRADMQRMKALAMHVMMINPAVEVYLLDNQGSVLAHALEGPLPADPVGSRIDMAPLQKLLQAQGPERVRLPILGPDPRQSGHLSTFSVAALPPLAAASSAALATAAPAPGFDPNTATPAPGYLYVVLNGNAAQHVAASLSNSDALRAMALGAAVASILAAAVLWLALRHLTNPLRALTAEVQAFRGTDSEAAGSLPGDEIAVLRQAVGAQQARIERQFSALEEADRQRRELVSNISHDLRTPLSNIKGYVETVLLRGENLDAQARATHLRTALRHVNLLGKRVADLFELSKLDAGRIEPQQEVFCLAELLQDVVQSYQLAAQQRQVKLALSAGSHAKARVRADIAMIERVLQNLIDNALRHTPPDGGVQLAIDSHGAFMQISVSDTGSGISQEHLPFIFERYWRAGDAQESAETAGNSAGLGLAIVKRILDLHGSAVQVSSEFKRGTRFEFLLPQAV